LMTSALNRVTVDSNGDVGIGASPSGRKLFVSDPVDVFTPASSAQFGMQGNGYGAYHYLNSVFYGIYQNSSVRSIRIISDTNGVVLSPGATSWASASDIRLKKNLENIEDGLDVLDNVRCVTYQLNTDDDTTDRRVGVIAQDLIGKADPVLTLSKEDPEGEEYYGVKYTELVPYLIKAIQQLKTRIEQLENDS